jgi:hypothetical protein
MLRVLSEELVCNDIIAKALDARHRVDVVVVVDGLFFRGRRVWVLETLRKAGIPTALVATDDPYEKIPGADHLFSLATTNEVRCATAQIPYLPTATREPTTIGDGEIIYDVVFIGTIFGDRWPLLYQLAEYCGGKRLRLLIAGNPLVDLSEQPGYDTVELRAETVPAAAKWRQYSQARVVLNLFRDCSEPADAPNPRVFETAALGGPALGWRKLGLDA